MNLKDMILGAENLETLKDLYEAGIDHRVIALFLSSEGISMKATDVQILVHHYDQLAMVKLPNKKLQALIRAKQRAIQDDSLPCPI